MTWYALLKWLLRSYLWEYYANSPELNNLALFYTVRSNDPGFFAHFSAYARLKNSRKSEFWAKNSKYFTKKYGASQKNLSFSKVYWIKLKQAFFFTTFSNPT